MRRRLVTILVLLVLLSTMVMGFGAGCGLKYTKNVLKVGVAGPMQFIMGRHHWLGAQMAADEINKAGGVLIDGKKYRIDLVQIDTNELLSVDDAAAAIERAISVDKVDVLVGSIRTEAALVMQEIAMDNKTIFIVCGASHTVLSAKVGADYERYKYWFRVTPINVGNLVKTSMILLNQVGATVRAELGIAKPKVAVIIEKAVAGDPLAAAAQALIPTFGMEFVGLWRPSPNATDVTAELTAIRDSGANIIYTYFSGPAGVPYAKQWGTLQIPAASVGINVEAQAMGFMQATNDMGNWEYTLNTMARVEITPKTIPYYDAFVERTGGLEFPTYNAGTYDAIYIWKEAIERANSADPDAIVVEMEKTDFISSAGRIVFDTMHDVKWGPGFVTAVGTQWQDGELVCCWPIDFYGVTYEGTVPYKLPPWMVPGG